MTARICQHDFPNDGTTCTHCGTHVSNKEKSCIWRDAPPRPVPVSVFADLGEIGDMMRKIQVDEGRLVPPPPAAMRGDYLADV